MSGVVAAPPTQEDPAAVPPGDGDGAVRSADDRDATDVRTASAVSAPSVPGEGTFGAVSGAAPVGAAAAPAAQSAVAVSDHVAVETGAAAQPSMLSGAAVLHAPFDVFVKLLLIGNSGVGKSSMLLRFADNAFNETYINTIGIDFKTRIVDIEGKRVKLQIWDTAGQERFQSLQTVYYRGAMGIVLVYDITDPKSFAAVRNWMSAVRQYASPAVALLLVGNKSDCPRAVPIKEAEDLAAEYGIPYVETSAKAGRGVTEAFVSITHRIVASGVPAPASRGGGTATAPTSAAGSTSAPVQLDPTRVPAKADQKPPCCQH